MLRCQWPDFASQNSLAGAFWQTNQINPAACQGWLVLRLNTERVSYFNMRFPLFGSWNLTQRREPDVKDGRNWTRAAVMGTECLLVRCCFYSARPHLSAGTILQPQRPTPVSSISVCCVCGLHSVHTTHTHTVRWFCNHFLSWQRATSPKMVQRFNVHF